MGGSGRGKVDQSPPGLISGHSCARALGFDGAAHLNRHVWRCCQVPQTLATISLCKAQAGPLLQPTETFLLQEVLELAFSILYDPDETLNFIAPNKYEVRAAALWRCLAQPSPRVPQWEAGSGGNRNSLSPKGRRLQAVKGCRTLRMCQRGSFSPEPGPSGHPSAVAVGGLRKMGQLGITCVPGSRKSFLFFVSVWPPTQAILTDPLPQGSCHMWSIWPGLGSQMALVPLLTQASSCIGSTEDTRCCVTHCG